MGGSHTRAAAPQLVKCKRMEAGALFLEHDLHSGEPPPAPDQTTVFLRVGAKAKAKCSANVSHRITISCALINRDWGSAKKVTCLLV
jgi:hypothetical protein